MAALQPLVISALIGVVIGNIMRDRLGGKRSSIGVHDSSGKLVSFPDAIVYFSFITVLISIATGIAADISTQIFGNNLALVIAFVIVVLLLADSYSR